MGMLQSVPQAVPLLLPQPAPGLPQVDDSSGELAGFVTIRDITRPLVLSVTINGAMEHPMLKQPVIGSDNIWLPQGADDLDTRSEPASLTDVFLMH